MVEVGKMMKAARRLVKSNMPDWEEVGTIGDDILVYRADGLCKMVKVVEVKRFVSGSTISRVEYENITSDYLQENTRLFPDDMKLSWNELQFKVMADDKVMVRFEREINWDDDDVLLKALDIILSNPGISEMEREIHRVIADKMKEEEQ